MRKRKTAIGRTDKGHLTRLQQLPEYYEVDVNIKGASDENKRSLEVYNSIYREFKKDKIGMSKYGFATLEEAQNFKSFSEDAAHSKGFKAIVAIRRVKSRRVEQQGGNF